MKQYLLSLLRHVLLLPVLVIGLLLLYIGGILKSLAQLMACDIEAAKSELGSIKFD